MPVICGNCGLSIEPDPPVKRDGWYLLPWRTEYHNRQISLTPARSALLYAIAASPGPIGRIALLNRTSDSENENTLAVQCAHLRRQLREQGAPIPFVSLRGTGKVLWLADDLHSTPFPQEGQPHHGAR